MVRHLHGVFVGRAAQTPEEVLWNQKTLEPPGADATPDTHAGVGVCVTGMQRTLFEPVLVNTLNNHLRGPLTSVFTDEGAVETFFVVASNTPTEDRKTLPPLVNANYPGAGLTVIDAAYPLFRCRPEGMPPVSRRFGNQTDGPCPKLVSDHALNAADSPSCDFLHVLVQWRAIGACYDMVHTAERRRKQLFQWLLRTRTDMVLLDTSLALRLASLSHDNVYVPKYGMSMMSSSMCQNDHIFVCPRRLCRVW